MDYVNSHTPEEIDKVIQPQFAETSFDQLTTIVKRYYEQDVYFPYEELVISTYAR